MNENFLNLKALLVAAGISGGVLFFILGFTELIKQLILDFKWKVIQLAPDEQKEFDKAFKKDLSHVERFLDNLSSKKSFSYQTWKYDRLKKELKAQ